MSTPKFSIIIPVYNVAPYLRECLDSVLAQMFTDWEAICVDDGSTDDSGAILDEYSAKDSRFRVIHKTNVGVSAARNAALDVAQGEWVGFVDGDDTIESDWLTHVDDAISKDPQSVVIRTGWTNWRGDEKVQRDQADVEPNLWMLIARCSFSVVTFFRRLDFRTIRYPVGIRFREDAIFLFRIAASDPRYTLITANGYNYRIRDDGATRERRRRDDTYQLLRCYSQIWSCLRPELRNQYCAASTLWIKKDVREWHQRCESKTAATCLKVWMNLWNLFLHGGFHPFAKDGWKTGVRWVLYLLSANHRFLFKSVG